MSMNSETIDAMVDEHGQIVLSQPLKVGRGPVKVQVWSDASASVRGMVEAFAAIDSRRGISGFVGRSEAELEVARRELEAEQDDRDREQAAARQSRME